MSTARPAFIAQMQIPLAGLLFTLLCGPVLATEKTVQAVWKSQELNFAYMGFTTYYSCDGLRDRVKELLKELGAREDLKVRSGGCDVLSGPARMPSVKIQVSTAIEATPEVLAELAKDSSRRELVARVQGEGATPDAAQQFAAVRRRVKLEANERNDIGAGDCELLEQLRDHVLPELGIRVVADDLRCVPKQGSIARQSLEVEALVKLPSADAAPSQ